MDKNTNRVQTGISGFDEICDGGFIKNSVNVVSGGAGTGKSIFSLSFLYNGVTKYGEKGLYISFEEDLDDLREDAKVFGMDFYSLEADKKVKFIYIYPYEIENFQQQLISEITRVGASRVVIDSTSAFGMALENEYEVRKQLYSLAAQLKKLNCTSVLISEIVGEDLNNSGKLSRFNVEEFVADSVITLHSGGLGGEADRAIRIVKMRRTNHAKGPVPLSIAHDGMKVHKRK